MAIFAQWINPEQTTVEVCIDGTTTYVVRPVSADYQYPLGFNKDEFEAWLSAGNEPIAYHLGG